MTVGSNTAGGFLKGTDHLGDRFVGALRATFILFDPYTNSTTSAMRVTVFMDVGVAV